MEHGALCSLLRAPSKRSVAVNIQPPTCRRLRGTREVDAYQTIDEAHTGADAGEWPVVRETLYLDDAVAGAVDAARARAGQRQVFVEVGAFEEARITGDAALVRQLLLIVLDNALKFTPAGGRVRLDVSAQNGRAAVVVTDTGLGIPAEQLPHVFERFYRGDRARHEAEGAGLGLAIARWIAEVHGADIAITSQPGHGTRVAISFPLAAA